MSTKGSRRFSPNRRRTNFQARADVGNGNIPITVVEISFRGMKINVPYNIPPGAGITVSIMDDEIPAIVHWCQSQVAGIHLLQNPRGATLKMLESVDDEFSEFR